MKGVPVQSQLAMLAELQGFSAAAARAEAARVLRLVLLADAAKKTPETLSHGMLKRIAIAQAFLGAPELVLLDEPTAGLDPATASEMKNLIRSLDKERTFIVSSHNLQDIEELCGSVVILDRGKIVEHRRVAELVGRTSMPDVPAGGRSARGDRRAALVGGDGDARRAGPAGRAPAGRSLPRRRGGGQQQDADRRPAGADRRRHRDDRDDARAVAAGQGHRDDAPLAGADAASG